MRMNAHLRGRGCACSTCSRSPSMVRITSLSSWAVPSRGPPSETSSSAQYPPSFSLPPCFPPPLSAAATSSSDRPLLTSSSVPATSLDLRCASILGWPLYDARCGRPPAAVHRQGTGMRECSDWESTLVRESDRDRALVPLTPPPLVTTSFLGLPCRLPPARCVEDEYNEEFWGWERRDGGSSSSSKV